MQSHGGKPLILKEKSMRWIVFSSLLITFSAVAQEQSELELKRMKWKDSYTLKARTNLNDLSVEDGLSDFADSVQRSVYVDTFVVERVYEEMLHFDGSTLGMNQANLYSMADYEALVFKYSEVVRNKLSQEDQLTFDEAQTAWLHYFEKERTFSGVLMNPEYSGGGTIQTLIYTNRLLDLQKQRLDFLLNCLIRMI